MKLNTYIFFNGQCEEAFNYYKSILGGEFDAFNRFKEGPMQVEEHQKEWVMHVDYRFDGNILMGSDNIYGGKIGEGFSLSLSFDDPEKMETIFNRFAEDGEVTMPLDNTFWGSRFGMLKDKFGISWMFSSPPKQD